MLRPTKAVVLAQPQMFSCARSASGERASLPPAALLPVANRTLLSHALGWLAESGVREAAVVVPENLAAEARWAAGGSHGVKSVSWLEQRPDETIAHALGDLFGFTEGEPFVMHLADSLARESLRAVIPAGAESDAEALLLVDEATQPGVADVVQLYTTGGPGTVTRRRLRHDSAGVAILTGRALEDAAELDTPPEHVLEALADRIEQRGGRVSPCSVGGWWRFRGGTDALLEGNRFALEAAHPDYGHARLVNATIQGAVIAHPEASIESSTVRGPAVIGARARIRDAYLGPYTSVGEDVEIDGAEVEHSIILRAASIKHLGGRMEASIVGANARVFHDFRLPRALRLNLGEGAEVCLG
jgi:glucose-1-phosphate thymidylyltransferase